MSIGRLGSKPYGTIFLFSFFRLNLGFFGFLGRRSLAVFYFIYAPHQFGRVFI